MKLCLLLLLLQSAAERTLIEEIAQSGRVVNLAESPSERLQSPRLIAPGQPPLLSFRYLEGRQKGRYANLDLVLDDAGH